MTISVNNSIILYPGCGTDFSPLLLEKKLSHAKPQVVQQIQLEWSISTLLMCDNSPFIEHYFHKLKEGAYIFNRASNQLLSEQSYHKAWADSEIDTVQIKSIDRVTINNFGLNSKEIIALDIKIEINQNENIAIKRVLYFPSSFEDVMHYSNNKPDSFHFIGIILLNIRRFNNLLKSIDYSDLKFIVSDESPHKLPDNFFHSFIFFRDIGKSRYANNSEASALFLHESEFKNMKKPLKEGFWVVPNLFVTGIHIDSGASSVHKVINVSIEVNQEEIRDILDRVDSALMNQQAVILTSGIALNRGLIVGCWLIRHRIAEGIRVKEYIERLDLSDSFDFNNKVIKNIIEHWEPGA